jgi:hypothetical protein
MEAERRRSDRVMLTIPLRIRGVDEYGDEFETAARTITLNRHGARLYVARPLHTGQPLMVMNLRNQREAQFRVTGPLTPITGKGTDYSVLGPLSPRSENGEDFSLECLDRSVDLWGIRFPAPAGGVNAESKALLACRLCQATELMQLALVEVDVLETAGILSRQCHNCNAITPWGYAGNEYTPEGTQDREMVLPGTAPLELPSGAERRKHRRAVLQLPILVRDYFGGVEITKSENVSKGGICFSSEKNYYLGEGLLVACPYNKNAQNLEIFAQVASRREIAKSNRKFYGVRYKLGA